MPAGVGTPSPAAGVRFRILRPHARGGLGEVFVARDEELNREVALKEIRPRTPTTPRAASRFILEAEITGGLEHPGIVPVYGLGHHADGRPYYAMRFIRGDSLKEAIERFHARRRPGRTRASGPGAARAARPVPRRLQRDGVRPQPGRAASRPQAGQHHARPLRRDAGGRLGPGQGDRRPDERGRPTESGADAGRGRRAVRASTRAGARAGHARLHEPGAGRRASSTSSGPASDVYSLGATLYSLLTGQAAVRGPTTSAMLDAGRAGRVPAPRDGPAESARGRWRRSA